MKDKSFSELSRKIIKKYSRAPWDKYERKERDAELDKLVEKQEEVRNELGLSDMQNSDTGYKHGGKMKYVEGGPLSNWFRNVNNPPPNLSNVNTIGGSPSLMDRFESLYGDPTMDNWRSNYNLEDYSIQNNPNVTLNSVNEEVPPVRRNTGTVSLLSGKPFNAKIAPETDSSSLASMSSTIRRNANNVSYEPYETSVLPSVFSYGTNLLGNLALSGLDQPRTVEGSYYTPQNVSYANERNVVQNQNTLARNILNRRLRGAGLSKGAYTAGLTSGSTGLDRNLAAQLGQSYQNEGNINAQLTNQARQYNAGERSRVNQLNESMEQARRERQRDYLASIIGGGSGLSRDITATRQQDDLISMLGRDYKIVRDPQTGRKVIQYIGR